MERPTINRAGFRKPGQEGTEYFVLPNVFKEEICKGLDSTFVARKLVEHGLIYPDRDGRKPTTSHKPPGESKTMRLYHFAASILEA